MANKRISQLPAAASPLAGGTLLPVELTTGDTKRATLQQMRSFVSVTDYGVVGNGVVNDTAALTAAIAAAANKTLVIPSGLAIYVTSQITLSSPIAIVMESGSSFNSGYASPSPDNGLINVTSSDVLLDGITINGQSNDHVGIKITGANRVSINGGYIYAYGQRSAIWFQSCAFCSVTGTRIGASIVASGAGNQGAIYANQCSDMLIREARISGFYGKGVSLRLSSRCSVTDCFVYGNPTSYGDGIYIGYDSEYISIVGCHIKDCGGNGVKLSRGAQRSTVSACTIVGTTVSGSGIMLQGAVQCTVSGNKIALNDAISATRAMIIQPHDEDAPGEGSDCYGNVICDNTFISYSTSVPAIQLDDNATGFTTYDNKLANNYIFGGQIGIAAYTVRCQFIGNYIASSATKGISVRFAASFCDVIGNFIEGNATDTALYIDLASGGQGLTVSNNKITNCGYGGIYVANAKRSNFTGNAVLGTGAAGSGVIFASTTNDVNFSENYVFNFPVYGLSATTTAATGINVVGNQFENCTVNAVDVRASTGRVIGNIAKSSGAFFISNVADLIHYGNSDKRLYVTTPNGLAQYAIAVDNAGAVTSTLV